MILTHLSTIQTETGLFLITVHLGSKNYEYRLQSEFAVRKFEYLYQKGAYGKSIQVLNKFKLKGKENEERTNRENQENDE